MTKRRGLREQSQTATILHELGEIADAFIDGMQRPAHAAKYGLFGAKDYRDELAWRKTYFAMKRLQKAQLIEVRKTAEGFQAALTKSGAEEYLRQQILSAPVIDGPADCMLIFDIPEKHRMIRDELRRFIIRAGFIQLQKSVFLCPYEMFIPLSRLFRVKGVRRWVRVFRVEEATDES